MYVIFHLAIEFIDCLI